MSSIVRAVAEQKTNDMYTCLLPGVGTPGSNDLGYDDIVPAPMLHCVDIGSPRTLDGMPPMVSVAGEARSVANISSAAAAADHADGMQLFGGAECGGRSVADGVVNTYDIAVLLWAQFARPPYDVLPQNRFEWADLPTVTGQEEAADMCCERFGVDAWTCLDGQPYTKAGYAAAVGIDPCVASRYNETGATAGRRRRRLAAAARLEELPLPGPCAAAGGEAWADEPSAGEVLAAEAGCSPDWSDDAPPDVGGGVPRAEVAAGEEPQPLEAAEEAVNVEVGEHGGGEEWGVGGGLGEESGGGDDVVMAEESSAGVAAAAAAADERRLAPQAVSASWTDEAADRYEAESGAIELLEWAAVAGVGAWTKVVLPDAALALELTLLNVAPSAAAKTLSFKSPPPRDCTEALPDCLPDEAQRDRLAVGFHRRDDAIEAAGFTADDCAMIYPTTSPLIDASGAIAVYQEPPTLACPFDIFVWVPEGLSLDANSVCGGALGVDAGSTLNDGRGGIVQMRVACAGVPSLSPAAAAADAGSLLGGGGVTGAERPVQLAFSVVLGGAVAHVDAFLLARFKVQLSARLGVSSALVSVTVAGDAPGRHRRLAALTLDVAILVPYARAAATLSEVVVALSAADISADLGGLPVEAVSRPAVSLVDAGGADGAASVAEATASGGGGAAGAVQGAVSGLAAAGDADSSTEMLVAAVPPALLLALLCGVGAVCATRRRRARLQNKVNPAEPAYDQTYAYAHDAVFHTGEAVTA